MRVVTVRPVTLLMVLGLTILVLLVAYLGYQAFHVLSWIFVSIVLAAALNPAVEHFERRGMRRGVAAGLVFGLALLLITAIGFLVIPPLVVQVADFVEAVPDFIDDLTAGRGPFGFLQDDYEIVDRVREAIEREGPGGVLGLGEPVLDVVRSVVTAVIGAVTIVFLTFFMLLEGPRTISRFLELLPPGARIRWERVGREIYRTISGYVTGNLLDQLRRRSHVHRGAVRGRQRLRDRARPPRRRVRPHPARRRNDRRRCSSPPSSSSRRTPSAVSS